MTENKRMKTAVGKAVNPYKINNMLPLYQRSNFECQYCGWKIENFNDYFAFTTDHVIPIHMKTRMHDPNLGNVSEAQINGYAMKKVRGEVDWTNLRLSCHYCNTLLNTDDYEIPSGTFEQQVKEVFKEKKRRIQERRKQVRTKYRELVVPAARSLRIKLVDAEKNVD